MDDNPFIAAEAILAGKGVSVARLCRRADIAESTWHRLRERKVAAGREATLAQLRQAFAELTGEAWPNAPQPQEAA